MHAALIASHVRSSGVSFATDFVNRHGRFAGYIEPDKADAQAELLRYSGLQVLNDKILGAPAEHVQVLDLIAGHNMAAMLARAGFTDLQREPSWMSRPVDLVGAHGGRAYRVEVKRLAASEHDALHGKVMESINDALKSDRGSIVIEMQLKDSFTAANINALTRHVKQALRTPRMGQVYSFAAADDDVVAWYTFAPDAHRDYPHIGILGDVGVLRDVTGDDGRRVRSKVRRAYEKFSPLPDDGAVHLLALEVDNFMRSAHVADALYGRECVYFTRSGPAGQGRHRDGAFGSGRYSRLDGVVLARRSERGRLFCGYNFTLFPNSSGALDVPEAAAALGAEQVLGPNDFP